MFRTLRFSKRAVTLLSLLLTALIIGGCFLLLSSGAPDTVTLGGQPYPLSARDAGEVEAFLAACGFQPQGCVSDRAITVPRTWNDVYTAYQELQQAQGLTLAPYRGKPARELIYASADSDDYAAVLASGGRIIAAHRCTMLLGDAPRALIPQGR